MHTKSKANSNCDKCFKGEEHRAKSLNWGFGLAKWSVKASLKWWLAWGLRNNRVIKPEKNGSAAQAERSAATNPQWEEARKSLSWKEFCVAEHKGVQGGHSQREVRAGVRERAEHGVSCDLQPGFAQDCPSLDLWMINYRGPYDKTYCLSLKSIEKPWQTLNWRVGGPGWHV